MTNRNISRLVALPFSLVALSCAVAACGSDTDAAESSSDNSSSAAVEVTPTTATPEQFASIIAGSEKDWRVVINNANGCRFDWTLGDDSALTQTTNMTCYVREVNAGYSAQSAIRAMSGLTPPESMTALVEETRTALFSVAKVQLEETCGDVTTGPKETKACDRALGNLYGAYQSLETALDSWGPYL